MIQKTPQAGDDLGRFTLDYISIFLFQSTLFHAQTDTYHFLYFNPHSGAGVTKGYMFISLFQSTPRHIGEALELHISNPTFQPTR